MSNVHFSSNTNEWYTPFNVFNELNKEFGFTLDPSCTKENAKCSKFFTIEDDGLSQDWSNDVVFCNPPYGREIKDWIKKGLDESKKGAVVVMLIPSRTDTKYWHEYIFGKAAEIRFIKGRLKFGGATTNAPFPSAIIVFDSLSGSNEITTVEF